MSPQHAVSYLLKSDFSATLCVVPLVQPVSHLYLYLCLAVCILRLVRVRTRAVLVVNAATVKLTRPPNAAPPSPPLFRVALTAVQQQQQQQTTTASSSATVSSETGGSDAAASAASVTRSDGQLDKQGVNVFGYDAPPEAFVSAVMASFDAAVQVRCLPIVKCFVIMITCTSLEVIFKRYSAQFKARSLSCLSGSVWHESRCMSIRQDQGLSCRRVCLCIHCRRALLRCC